MLKPGGTGALMLRDDMVSGKVNAEAVVAAYLEKIAVREPDIQAWAWIDVDHALNQAKALDEKRQAGELLGALHGLPVGIKDIIDTQGIPTCNGTALDAGRVPTKDAFVVQQLKRAGAVIMGKTVTTELAFLEPSKTRHPQDATRTPGGSSSGSAAAVASGMVPLAIGTQTGGSVIRPAAFCGVTGFKPSFGKIARSGVLNQSQTLDTLGVFGRKVIDVALLADSLFGYHPDDNSSLFLPAPQLLSIARSKPGTVPNFAFIRTPFWSRAEPLMQQALENFVETLGDRCFEATLSSAFAEAADIRALINRVEMATNFETYARRDASLLSQLTRDFMAEGDTVLAKDYLMALDFSDKLNTELEDIFDQCDAIIAPSTTGPAPGIESTGDPVFNGIWTLCGTPAVTLPLLADADGMPMGVQLIGRCGDDARLLRTARWIEEYCAAN